MIVIQLVPLVVVSVRWKKIQYVISELAIVSVKKMSMASVVIVAKMDSSIYNKILNLAVNVSNTDVGGDCVCEQHDGGGGGEGKAL